MTHTDKERITLKIINKTFWKCKLTVQIKWEVKGKKKANQQQKRYKQRQNMLSNWKGNVERKYIL